MKFQPNGVANKNKVVDKSKRWDYGVNFSIRKKEPGRTPAKFNREASRLGDVGAIKKHLLFYCPLPSVAPDSLSIAT